MLQVAIPTLSQPPNIPNHQSISPPPPLTTNSHPPSAHHTSLLFNSSPPASFLSRISPVHFHQTPLPSPSHEVKRTHSKNSLAPSSHQPPHSPYPTRPRSPKQQSDSYLASACRPLTMTCPPRSDQRAHQSFILAACS
jgi:hypothetical protein